jgi:glutaredoxin
MNNLRLPVLLAMLACIPAIQAEEFSRTDFNRAKAISLLELFSHAGADKVQVQNRCTNQTGFPQVDLYVTSWCPYCKKAIAFFRKNNIPYIAHDIEKDLDAAARKAELDPNYGGIPLAVINGTSIRGFDETTYKQALQMR